MRRAPTRLAVAGLATALLAGAGWARADEPTVGPVTTLSGPPAPLTIVTATPSTQSPWVALRLSGYIQADGVLYDQASEAEVDPSTGAPLNQTRYLIRRGRIHIDVDHGRMAGAMEVDFNTVNGPAVGLIDAEVTVRARARDDTGRPWGDASIGLLRTPWGYEVLERDQDRFFLERSTVSRALFPGVFDLGIRARAGWRFVNAQIALMNGDPVGDRTFPVQDPNQAKDVVGRVGVAGLRRRVAFSAGLSGLSGVGFHKGTPETKDVLVWRDQNQDGIVQLSEIQVIPGSAATPSQNFSRFALGADAEVTIAVPRLGALGAFVEAMWASNLDRGVVLADPVASGRNLRERGWVIGVVQELGAHLAVGGRFDHYDPDADAFQAQAATVVPVDASFTTWTGTFGYRLNALDRVTGEYQHVTNPLGRTASGVPTTLGADTFTVRGQIAW